MPQCHMNSCKMKSAIPVLLVLAACGSAEPDETGRGGATEAATPELHAQLYSTGIPYNVFLAGVRERAELWRELSAPGLVPSEAVGRARAAAAAGDWRVLVVADEGCSDSASTIPWIARLAEGAGIPLRVVDAAAGRPIMEAYRTPDGRAATPTVLLLDGGFETAGCWIERPAALQAWTIERGSGLPTQQFSDRKAGWYLGDRGRDTVLEFVELLEAAAAGGVACPGTGAGAAG
jgi:hypothetical protein